MLLFAGSQIHTTARTSQMETRDRNWSWLSSMGGKDLNARTITCCFPRYCLPRCKKLEWNSELKLEARHSIMGLLAGMLTIAFPPLWHLTVCVSVQSSLTCSYLESFKVHEFDYGSPFLDLWSLLRCFASKMSGVFVFIWWYPLDT